MVLPERDSKRAPGWLLGAGGGLRFYARLGARLKLLVAYAVVL